MVLATKHVAQSISRTRIRYGHVLFTRILTSWELDLSDQRGPRAGDVFVTLRRNVGSISGSVVKRTSLDCGAPDLTWGGAMGFRDCFHMRLKLPA